MDLDCSSLHKRENSNEPQSRFPLIQRGIPQRKERMEFELRLGTDENLNMKVPLKTQKYVQYKKKLLGYRHNLKFEP